MGNLKQTGAVPAILAIDLGTQTGWALRGSNGIITSGTIGFKSGQDDGGGMRYLRFSRWLREINSLSSIQEIYYEKVARHLGTRAAQVYGGFHGQLTCFAEEMQIPYSGIPVGTIKKFITGKGNSNKELVIKAIQDLGYLPADNNEADALALLMVVLDHEV